VSRRPPTALPNLPRVQRILLLGEDHTELGDVAVDSLGPMAAALTRGRHPKAYPYLEPNEDALVIASDGDFHLVAVADGHNGTAASHAAIRAIRDAAPALADLEPVEAAAEATLTARDALVLLPPPSEDLPRSATTLTVVAIKGDAGAAAGWGDSVTVLLRGRRAPRAHRPCPQDGDRTTDSATARGSHCVASTQSRRTSTATCPFST
jgi:hypothetical protein